MKYEDLVVWIEKFFQNENLFNIKVLDMIENYKTEWYKVYLLSASLDIIALYLQNKFSYDWFYSSKLWFINWICTWKLEFDCSHKKIN